MARLAFLLPDMRGGGAERVALTLIEELRARGHSIDLVLMRAEGELLGLLPADVRVVELGARRFREGLMPLVRYLRANRPDAVQASLWPITIIAILARLLARTNSRVVVSDHSLLSVQYAGSRTAMAALKATTRLLYPLADARVCVSADSADDLAQLSGMDRERFTVIANPMPRPPEQAPAPAAIEALWRGAARRILTVGSLKPAKEHALLLRAFALLDPQLDARLMILGDGPLRTELEKLAAELGIADRVLLPGFAADPWPYYRSARQFVLSSSREGYPGVLLEALAAGLPVVSTDCGSGVRQILDNGRYGKLVPVGDAEALAAAMGDVRYRAHDPKPGQSWSRDLDKDSVGAYEALLVRDD